MAKKDNFPAMVEHELGNLILPIKTELQMLEKECYGKMNKEQKESVRVALGNIKAMERMLDELLEMGKFSFRFGKVDAADCVKSAAREFRKVKIIKKIGEVPAIRGDRERVMQVLRNLLKNAVKFSGKNGRVEVGVKKEKGFALFSVRDNGVGIPEKEQKGLFRPFYQTTEGRKVGGSGLGLAVSKEIVKAHKGDIWVESEAGKGSTFYFRIPLHGC